jgi:ankyrin repeat protein
MQSIGKYSHNLTPPSNTPEQPLDESQPPPAPPSLDMVHLLAIFAEDPNARHLFSDQKQVDRFLGHAKSFSVDVTDKENLQAYYYKFYENLFVDHADADKFAKAMDSDYFARMDSNGMQVLHHATLQGNLQVVEDLLKLGTDPNAGSRLGAPETPIPEPLNWVDTPWDENPEVGPEVQGPLQRPAPTPLICAIAVGKPDVVNALLNADASVEIQSPTFGRPMSFAADRFLREPTVERYTILKLLLDRGANPDEFHPQGNNVGPTPLISAIASHNANTASMSLEAVKTLLNAGASALLPGTYLGHLGSPLIHAGTAILLSPTTEACTILKLLVQHGAEPNTMSPSGDKKELPLARVLAIIDPEDPASQPHLLETVEFLLSHGAHPALLDDQDQLFLGQLRSLGHIKN